MTETNDNQELQTRKINLSYEHFQSGIARYSPHEKELLEWLWGYAHQALNNSADRLAMAVGCDYKVLLNIFNGKTECIPEGFIAAFERLKKRSTPESVLIQTPVTRRIEEALNYARDYHALVTIVGPTGRSKTSTVMDWQIRNNHGKARYVRCPSGCTRRTLATTLSQSFGIGSISQRSNTLEMRLMNALSPRNTLIIDEAGHLMPRRSGGGTLAVELIRDLHDCCGCGVVLVFTDVYVDEMRNGNMKDYFEQFVGRIKFERRIPAKVFKDEVRAVVASFRPNPPEKLVDEAWKIAAAGDGKLRTLFEDLQRAAEFARINSLELDVKALKLSADWRKSGGVWDDVE